MNTVNAIYKKQTCQYTHTLSTHILNNGHIYQYILS